MLPSLPVSLRATIIFLIASRLSLLQNFPGDKSSPALQLCVVLRVHIAIASRPRWLALFLLEHDKGELQPHQLFCGVGLAHLPTLVLLMAGAQWRLRSWTEGPVVPLGV